MREGVLNETLVQILLANSREPLQVEGDLVATTAAGEECARCLNRMMAEFDIETLDELAEHIIENSRDATIAALRGIPEGVYHNRLTIDGYDSPVELDATMTVSENAIHVDFEGSSPQSPHGINVVLNYTLAYTCFGLKCVVAPDIPNNHGSLEPFTVGAPEGSILNPRWPAPVSARHIIGHALPDTVMGCLYKAAPESVLAESGMMWNPYLRGESWFDGIHRAWEMFYFQSGGMGARAKKDGLNATAFPAGIKNIPVESAEAVAPVIFWRKELRTDSGGAGQYRGGVGQLVEIGSAVDAPMSFQAMFDRIDHPACGRAGGRPGKPGFAGLQSGEIRHSKGNQTIPRGDRLRLELPGGGGFGDPFERDPRKVANDVALGLVSRAAADEDYGVVIASDASVDDEATIQRRSK